MASGVGTQEGLSSALPLQLAFFHVRGDDKPAVLLHLLRNVVKPQDQTVVFVATKHHTEYLKEASGIWGCPACPPVKRQGARGVPRTPLQTHVRSAPVIASLLESLPLFRWVEGEIPAHVIVEVLHPPTPRREGGAQRDLGVWAGIQESQGTGQPCLSAEGACPGGI